MTLHEQVQSAYQAYMREEQAVAKKVKAASTRARKALMDLIKVGKERRKEIIETLKD